MAGVRQYVLVKIVPEISTMWAKITISLIQPNFKLGWRDLIQTLNDCKTARTFYEKLNHLVKKQMHLVK